MRAEKTVELEAGQPMVFGSDRDKGLRVRNYEAELCRADEADVWNPSVASTAPAMVMAEIRRGLDLPVPIGVFRDVQRPLFEDSVHAQIDEQTKKKGPGKLRDLVYSGDTWEVG